MSAERLRLAVVIGSIREGRIGPGIADWYVEEAREHGEFDIDVIDLADVKLPDRITEEPPAQAKEVAPRFAAADAFVLVTPEYNRSYPASLKTAIDWHFAEWQAKPVALVSYGGMGAGIRASEALRAPLTELHATVIRDTVSIANVFNMIGEDNKLTSNPGLNGAVKTQLDQLTWWAHALRDAKAKRPFQAGPAV